MWGGSRDGVGVGGWDRERGGWGGGLVAENWARRVRWARMPPRAWPPPHPPVDGGGRHPREGGKGEVRRTSPVEKAVLRAITPHTERAPKGTSGRRGGRTASPPASALPSCAIPTLDRKTSHKPPGLYPRGAK